MLRKKHINWNRTKIIFLISSFRKKKIKLLVLFTVVNFAIPYLLSWGDKCSMVSEGNCLKGDVAQVETDVLWSCECAFIVWVNARMWWMTEKTEISVQVLLSVAVNFLCPVLGSSYSQMDVNLITNTVGRVNLENSIKIRFNLLRSNKKTLNHRILF